VSFFSRMFSRDKRGDDGGGIYDPVAGGKAIELDSEEEEAIQSELADHQSSIGNILNNLAAENRYLPQDIIDQLYEQPVMSEATAALKKLAYQRYLDGRYKAAANSCIRALGYAGQEKQGVGREQEPEIWHLLARIHATVGRPYTASRFLDQAEKRMREVGRLDHLPSMLQQGWKDGVRSLRQDIAGNRLPAPQRTVFHETLEWLEVMPEI
jgi:hypothetical protein